MQNNLKTSLKTVFYERISSPLTGAFVLSWLIWNWKLVYFLLFPETDFSLHDRVDFVQVNFINFFNTLLYPFLLAVFLVCVYPLFTTGAIWVRSQYNIFQKDLKSKIENQQLIPLEQSMQLRAEINDQMKKYDALISSKERELADYKSRYEVQKNELALEKNKVTKDIAELRQELESRISKGNQALANYEKSIKSHKLEIKDLQKTINILKNEDITKKVRSNYKLSESEMAEILVNAIGTRTLEKLLSVKEAIEHDEEIGKEFNVTTLALLEQFLLINLDSSTKKYSLTQLGKSILSKYLKQQ
ncbi:hypothetical protein ACFLQT_00535 [Bacteroidota bacterium]